MGYFLVLEISYFLDHVKKLPQFSVKCTLLRPTPKIMKYAKSESLKQLPEALESNTGILMAGNINIMIILRPPAYVDYLEMNVHFY